MSFVSYAQNFEDLVLWRALKGVNSGFYIDVGAADPEEISVTKAFYDQGWSGINIEPTPIYFERLVQARPRDLNLNVAAGAAPGLMVLNQISGTGLSTSDGEVARRHAEAGWQSLEKTVPMLTLTSICSSQDITEIHFLKVDVEGAEADVLRGMDFTRYRPWIIVVEATEPLSPTRVDGSYEDLLLSHRYQRAYFDGLNVFYVAEEHAELGDLLAMPPNVFDDYVTVRQHGLEHQVRENAETINTLSFRVKDQDDELNLLRSATIQGQAAREAAEVLLAALRQEHGETLAALRQEHDGTLAALRQEHDGTLAALRQELGEAKEGVQRVSLHTDQLKRRLLASHEDVEQHQEAVRTMRLQLDAAQLERDALLVERDAALAERISMQAARDALLAELETVQMARDALWAAHDALLLERDTVLAAQDSQSSQLRELRAVAAQLAQEQNRLHTAHASVASLLDAVRVSTSWRLTRPVRVIGRAVKAGLQRPGS